MHGRTRGRKAVLLALSALLILTTAACKKDGDDSAQGGKVKNTTSSVTSTTSRAGAAGVWTGTVSTDFATTSIFGDQTYAATGKVAYSDLVPLPAGQTEAYSAVTAGGGSNRDTGYCSVTGGMTTMVTTWAAAGRDPNNNGETRASLDISDVVDAVTGARGTTITPSRLALVADIDQPCGSPPFPTVNVIVGGFEGGDNGRPTVPVPDGDPAPGHLVGTVTYTLTSPPYPLFLPPNVEYRYTITYDLRRSVSDADDCPEVGEVKLAARWDPWTKNVSLAATEVKDATYTWSFDDGIGMQTVTSTKTNGIDHAYGNGGPVDPSVSVKVEDCDPVVADTHIVVDPINYYAPSLQFDSEEKFFAGDPNDFIARSRLRYTDDVDTRCDETLADVGAVEPSRLGSAAGGSAYVASCGTVIPPVNSVDAGVLKTQPSGGYFLDTDGDDGIKGTADAPMFAEFVDGLSDAVIIYWLWYPHNEWKDGPVVEIHEGDWEHVVVRLDAESLEAKQVAFYQHYCAADIHDFGSLTRDTFAASSRPGEHFFVYVARGGHASFAAPADGRRGSCGPSYDFVDGNGDIGRGWFYNDNVRDASNEPWYGFAGAWGNRSSESTPVDAIDNYGPPGPGPERSIREDAVPAAWLD